MLQLARCENVKICIFQLCKLHFTANTYITIYFSTVLEQVQNYELKFLKRHFWKE